MSFTLLLLIAGIFGTVGDVLCKYAAKANGIAMYGFALAAALCWGSGALWWTTIYKTRNITEVMAIYSPAQLLALGLCGVLLFNEPLTPRLIVAFTLLFVAIWLMTS